jgi:hypothetical protein
MSKNETPICVDSQNKPLSDNYTRSDVHSQGIWHRTVNYLVIDSQNGNIYVQSKKPFDEGFFLNINGGHTTLDDSSYLREAEEELGINESDILNSHFLGKYQISVTFSEVFVNREFMYFYILDIPNFGSKFSLADGEAKDVLEFSALEAYELLKGNLSYINARFLKKQTSVQLETKHFRNFTDDQLYKVLMREVSKYLAGENLENIFI